jgi:ketosteroid isomerase-like protein
MGDEPQALIERLFDAFNHRDAAGIVAVCDEEMEFFPVTAQEIGRPAPYVGPAGLHDYLDDVSKFWEELLITPQEVSASGSRLLVRGRVYLRSRELGIRDMPAAWIWELRDGFFIRGEVFVDPVEADRRFAEEPSGRR